MKYKVRVSELRYGEVEVDAESEEAAKTIATGSEIDFFDSEIADMTAKPVAEDRGCGQHVEKINAEKWCLTFAEKPCIMRPTTKKRRTQSGSLMFAGVRAGVIASFLGKAPRRLTSPAWCFFARSAGCCCGAGAA